MERDAGKLTGSEICSIIRTGRKYNITKITIGDIVIEFDRQAPDIFVPDEVSPAESNEKVRDEIADLHREEIVEQIKLSDPDRYEQMLADGIIEDINGEED